MFSVEIQFISVVFLLISVSFSTALISVFVQRIHFSLRMTHEVCNRTFQRGEETNRQQRGCYFQSAKANYNFVAFTLLFTCR